MRKSDGGFGYAATDLAAANALVFDVMNEQMLQRFNTTHKYNLIAGVRRTLTA